MPDNEQPFSAKGMQEATQQGSEAARRISEGAMSAGAASMAEFTRMFSELKLPGVPDMDAVMAAYRRNLDVLSQANRLALEGAQQVARRNMEIMQQTMGEMTEAMRGLAGSESPQARASKQTEMLKTAYERAVLHIRELTDLIQRSNGEALTLLNGRFSEAMDEVRGMVEKSKG